MPDETIVVAYCFDRNYAPYAAVSTYSLLKHNTSKLRIYWCVGEADLGFAGDLAHAVREKTSHELSILCLRAELFADWKTSFEASLTSHYSAGAFFRLLLPDALPEDRIVYIDCDTIVQGDLAELYRLDMQGKSIGAVPDRWASMLHRMPLAPGEPYVNTGVLLLDLSALRNEGFWDKCRAIYETHSDDIKFVDQCIINKFAEGRKFIVPEKWNRLIAAGSRLPKNFDRVEDARIVHFYSAIKPWQEKSDSRMSAFWWSYARELGIAGVPVPVS